MAGLSITWTKADNKEFQQAVTVADLDVGRLVMAHAEKYRVSPADVDEILRKVGEEWIVSAVNYVHQHEQQKAALDASSAVQKISIAVE